MSKTYFFFFCVISNSNKKKLKNTHLNSSLRNVVDHMNYSSRNIVHSLPEAKKEEDRKQDIVCSAFLLLGPVESEKEGVR
jgi:hypothetical protein